MAVGLLKKKGHDGQDQILERAGDLDPTKRGKGQLGNGGIKTARLLHPSPQPLVVGRIVTQSLFVTL